MAFIQSNTLDSVGINTPYDTYIRIGHVASVVKSNAFKVNVTLYVYASQQAFLDGKSPVSNKSYVIDYDTNTDVNIHTFVYNALKLLPEFSTAVDA